MPPKASDSKAAVSKGAAAAAAPPAEAEGQLSEWAMRELRDDFLEPSLGEQLAVELANDLLERSSALYIDTLYDRLAIDYTAAALWEQMSSIVAVCNVQPDRDAVGETDAKAAADEEAAVGNGSMMIPPISTSESGIAERQGSMTSAAIAPSAVDSRHAPSKGAAKSSSAKTPKSTKTPRSVRIADANAPELAATPTALPTAAVTDVPPVDAQPSEVMPAPTWQADAAPARVPCDRHTRHNIPMQQKKPPTPATTAPTPSDSASPGSAGRRRRGPRSNASGGGTSDPNMLGSTLRGTLSDAGSSRPASRASSASGGMRSSMRPSAQAQRRMSRAPAAASSGRRGSAGATATGEPERQSTPQQEQPPQLTAEEQAVLAAAAADEQRKDSVRRTHAQIAAQLADTKSLERGFVVDGPSAKVVPLIPAEEMLSSAKKLAEPLKFNVPEPPAYPPPPNTAPAATPATQRVGGGKPADGKKSEAKRSALNARREDNYFVPDHTAVAMVQPVTPVGGVTVKDTDGAPRSTEMQVPRNKMTKADFNTASKAQQQQQQNPDGSGTPQERAFEPITGLPKPGAPNTARQSSAAKQESAKGASTARPSLGTGDPAKAAPTRPQPPSTAPQGVARRLPLTPASTGNQPAGSPVSRKAKGRSQAAANPTSARKPSVTAAAPSLARELLSDDL